MTFEMSSFESHILHEVGTYINLNKKVECSGLYGLANSHLFSPHILQKCISLPFIFGLVINLIGQRNVSRGGSVPVIGLYFRKHQILLLVPQEAPEYLMERTWSHVAIVPLALVQNDHMEQSYRPVSIGINVCCCQTTLGVVSHQKLPDTKLS